MDEASRLVAQSAGEEAQVLAQPLTFEAFFEAEAPTLFRRLCAVTGNSAEAEEIMQDAFLAMWERWDRIGSVADATAYLYRTSMNVFRKRARRTSLVIRRACRSRRTRSRSRDRRAAGVIAALVELTPRQRAALILTEVLDSTSEEAGRTLGITPGTVRGLVSRARARLRRQVGERT